MRTVGPAPVSVVSVSAGVQQGRDSEFLARSQGTLLPPVPTLGMATQKWHKLLEER